MFSECCRILITNKTGQHSDPEYFVYIKSKVMNICSVDVKACDLGKTFLKILAFQEFLQKICI